MLLDDEAFVLAEEALVFGVGALRGVSTTSGWGITPSADGVLIPDLSLIVMPFISEVEANCCRYLKFVGRDLPARRRLREEVGNFFSFSAAVCTLAWHAGGELIRLAWMQGCSLTRYSARGIGKHLPGPHARHQKVS